MEARGSERAGWWHCHGPYLTKQSDSGVQTDRELVERRTNVQLSQIVIIFPTVIIFGSGAMVVE